jgi:D-lactate dehydrogenase
MSDRIMQVLASFFPKHLPPRMKEYHHRFEHHLLLRVSASGLVEAQAFLQSYFSRASGAYFKCTPKEGKKAFLHRFVTAGAAVRMNAIHNKKFSGMVALDIALKRNERQWFETLPPEIEKALAKKIYYGHFLCHVLHQDYLLKPSYDPLEIEHQMWELLDQRGAEYPAEHNVGHLYHAKPSLQNFYRKIDPHNCFNPGIGQTSKRSDWV